MTMLKWSEHYVGVSHYIDGMDGEELVAFIEIHSRGSVRFLCNFRHPTPLLRYDGGDDYV